MKLTYSGELVEHLVSQLETLVYLNNNLQRQVDAVDAAFVGTRYNWVGTGRGRIEVLKEALEKAEEAQK